MTSSHDHDENVKDSASEILVQELEEYIDDVEKEVVGKLPEGVDIEKLVVDTANTLKKVE